MPSDKVSDYCVKEEKREQGVWGGRAAKALGLEEAVTREAFIDLVNNKVPGTQERLTLRDKDQRRPGYDFCFSVPKSVSVYHAISGDLVYAAFTHTVTRPVDGIPDPHLHVHCYVAVGTHRADRTSDALAEPNDAEEKESLGTAAVKGAPSEQLLEPGIAR